ncbi:cadherin domain-containing protein, partial [Opitutales bacterium]|nr:cadherin domain-containing protein [Opitutales bacterium]
FYGDSENSFSRSISISEYPGGQKENRVSGAAAIDINQDGRLDIFLTNKHGVPGRGLINNGEGNFTNFWDSTTPSFQRYLEIEDFNNDGLPDLVDSYFAGVNFLKSDGGLRTTEDISRAGNGMTWQPSGGPLGVGDMNGDGLQDVVILMGLDGNEADKTGAFVLHNTDGTGKFDFITSLGRGEHVFKAADIGDFDNDGDGDVALLKNNSSELLLYENLGDGNFSLFEHDFEFTNGSDVEFVDYDNDGDLDLAISGSQKVWENESPITITYQLVSGEGDGNNSLFTLDQNGTLKTASVLDYEMGDSLTIRVQAKDELNATTEGNFTVGVMDDPTDNYPQGGTTWDMNVTQVEIGESVGLLYLKSNGDLFGAFQNSNGMLGTGNTLYQQAGELIAKNVQKIDVGNGSSAFLKKDGTLWGMGRTNRGGGDAVDMFGSRNLLDVLTPVQVASDVRDFALNTGHLLFIKSDGSLWGIGDGYALGLGEKIPAETANMIVPSGVVQVSTNSWHTLFVKSDGSLWGMGSGGYGKLGNGKTDNWSHQSSEKIPFQIESSGVIQASAGWHHSMFVKTDGSLWAIGANWQGRLGDGTETQRSRPVQVIDSTGNVSYVSAGVSHTLFIKTDGSLWGMGDNSQGQLGDGTTEHRLSPILIENTDTLSVSIRRKSFYVKADGTIWAMGQSLFRGAPAKQITPTQIPQLLSYDGKVGVSPEGFGYVVGYKNSNGTATLVPYPKAVNNSLQSPYKFSHWTGDFGASLDSNITLAFDSNVTAHFTRDLNDSDNDSITNYDELMIYDTNPDRNDTDGDGFTDGLEISSNTDPKATSIPGDYVDQISSVKTGIEGTSIISGNSNGQVAVGGENGVEIYQIENNGSIRLVTKISPPEGSDPRRFSKYNLAITNEILVIDDRTVNRGMCHIYSVGDSRSDFSLLSSTRSAYQGSWDWGVRNMFSYDRTFVCVSEEQVQREVGDHPTLPKDSELWMFDVYEVGSNNVVSKIASLRHPTPEDVLGDLVDHRKGTLTHYQRLGYPLLHNGVVALPIYARFDSDEWMYVVRMSVEDNSILSIHEPSAPGRISSMVMDDEQLIVNHPLLPEVGGFVDTFRLSDGNRTTLKNTPGSNEFLSAWNSAMVLDSNGIQLYAVGGRPLDYDVIPNKTLSLPLPLSESSLPVAQYPSSSGKFALTENFFVSLDTYTSNNLQNNPETYNVIRVYPKAVHNKAPTDLNSTALLSIAENQPIGTIVGEFNATDPEGDAITYHLVSGEGDNNNSLFTLDTNGMLRSAEVFDFEQNQEFIILVQAKNESNLTTEKQFVVSITNDPSDDPVVNQPPAALQTLEPLTVDENQPSGTQVGQFTAEDPDGDDLTFQFVSGENNNSHFTLDTDGALKAARSFDFEVDGASFTIEVEARDSSGARVTEEFEVSLVDEIENSAPTNLRAIGELSVMENQPAGTQVVEFTAEDPDGDGLTFDFVSGENNNSLFSLETNGSLSTAHVFDFEVDGASFTIEVEARDPSGESAVGEFVVTLIDDPEGAERLVVKNFVSSGFTGRIGTLEVQGMQGLTFQLGPDEFGNLHHFTLSKDGELTLVEELWESGIHTLNILIFDGDELVAEPQITIEVDAPEREDFLAADTTDPAYHESALMIRDLDVVQHDWRNGHNPIKSIGSIEGRDGLFVTTAQPHGRKVGDSVVLSGVKGLQIEGLKNWNFLIDEVNATSFRVRHFGKNANGVHDGSFGQLARAVVGTAYLPTQSDFLLGPWTFGHLLGNMVGEQDDPVTFYKHFANQWKNKQTVNGWATDKRPKTHRSMVPEGIDELTLSNLPFRLL